MTCERCLVPSRPFAWPDGALAVLMAGALAGCKTTGSVDTTGSIASGPTTRSEADWRRDSEALGEKFRANPRDADNAIRYAQALRATGQRTQAAAVLETAAIHNPGNSALLGAYGRALADAGNFKQALDVLQRAHSPDQPDWRILSVQGAVLDQLGRHEEAQRYYASALQDRAGRAFGAVQSRPLLRALEGPEARRGDAAPRRPRAAATTSACGRTSRWWSACKAASRRPSRSRRADLPPDQAAENVAYLRACHGAAQGCWRPGAEEEHSRARGRRARSGRRGRVVARGAGRLALYARRRALMKYHRPSIDSGLPCRMLR